MPDERIFEVAAMDRYHNDATFRALVDSLLAANVSGGMIRHAFYAVNVLRRERFLEAVARMQAGDCIRFPDAALGGDCIPQEDADTPEIIEIKPT